MRLLLLSAIAAPLLTVVSSQQEPPACDTTAAEQRALMQQAIAQLPAGYSLFDKGIMKFMSGNIVVGNNPSSLYGVYEWLGGLFPAAWIGPQDAWVWLGCTPPNLKYFSSRSYVFDEVSPTGSGRTTLFASLGDSNNILTFNTTAGGPCNRTAATITTADATTADAVAGALVAAGLDAAAINIDVIPSSLVKMGRNLSTDDLFMSIFRVALFDSAADGAAYVNSTWPVYLIYPPPALPANLFPVPALRPRGTGHGEGVLAPALAQLQADVTALWTRAGGVVLDAQPGHPVPIDGFVCIRENADCAGDNRDAAYVGANETYLLSDDSTFIMVLGVNHVQTLGVVYSNIAVYDADVGDGVAGVDDSHFAGSVQHFSPSNPNATALYAYAISRNCSSIARALPYCYEVNATALPLDHAVLMAERAYLQTATLTGPLYSELLMPVVMHIAAPPQA